MCNHFALGLLVVSLIGCRAHEADNNDHRKSSSAKAERSLKESFDVHFPSGPKWKTIMDGQLAGITDTYNIAVADLEQGNQFTVTVSPTPKDSPTFAAKKDEWARGFLKKASRKKSAKMTKVGKNDAYMVTGEVDMPNGDSYEVIGILIVSGGRDFMLAIARKGSNALDDPDVQEFVKSFRVLSD